MKLNLNTHINAPAELVWTVLADEFVQVTDWLPSVVRATALQDTDRAEGAPIAGRVCEFTEKPDGLQAHEKIIRWSQEEGRLELDVVVHNAPVVIPVKKNIARFQVKASGEGAEVTLDIEPTLKPHGYLLYPLVKKNFNQQFSGLLSKLKAHVERRHSAVA